MGDNDTDYVRIGGAIEAVLERLSLPPQDGESWYIAEDIIAAKKEGRNAMRFLVTYEGFSIFNAWWTVWSDMTPQMRKRAAIVRKEYIERGLDGQVMASPTMLQKSLNEVVKLLNAGVEEQRAAIAADAKVDKVKSKTALPPRPAPPPAQEPPPKRRRRKPVTSAPAPPPVLPAPKAGSTASGSATETPHAVGTASESPHAGASDMSAMRAPTPSTAVASSAHGKNAAAQPRPGVAQPAGAPASPTKFTGDSRMSPCSPRGARQGSADVGGTLPPHAARGRSPTNALVQMLQASEPPFAGPSAGLAQGSSPRFAIASAHTASDMDGGCGDVQVDSEHNTDVPVVPAACWRTKGLDVAPPQQHIPNPGHTVQPAGQALASGRAQQGGRPLAGVAACLTDLQAYSSGADTSTDNTRSSSRPGAEGSTRAQGAAAPWPFAPTNDWRIKRSAPGDANAADLPAVGR